jgi:lipoprotein-releasing system ATP-binding protein
MMALLEVKELNKSYQSGPEILPILRNISFSVEEGDAVVVTGESGSGKSTILNLLGGLDGADSGSIVVNQKEIVGLSEEALGFYRRDYIGFIFQFHHLLKDFTALENVMLPCYMAGKERKEAMERGRDLLSSVGLDGRSHHFPAQLSGGERQRVALARALVNDPDLILADEPTGNLDEKNSRMVEDLLFDLVKNFKKTLILVTHDPLFSRKGTIGFHLEAGMVRRL